MPLLQAQLYAVSVLSHRRSNRCECGALTRQQWEKLPCSAGKARAWAACDRVSTSWSSRPKCSRSQQPALAALSLMETGLSRRLEMGFGRHALPEALCATPRTRTWSGAAVRSNPHSNLAKQRRGAAAGSPSRTEQAKGHAASDGCRQRTPAARRNLNAAKSITDAGASSDTHVVTVGRTHPSSVGKHGIHYRIHNTNEKPIIHCQCTASLFVLFPLLRRSS